MHLVTRISYNSNGWQRPTGEASKQEIKTSFNSLHRFGFEDWFFRGEWQIDGWQYAFLQGANIKCRKYIGTPLDISLYTIQPDKRRRWVADIEGLECLDTVQSEEAQEFFQRHGWLNQMQQEVREVGGNPDTILATEYAGHFLNVRYRVANLRSLPPDTLWEQEHWAPPAAYYKFYALDERAKAYLAAIAQEHRGRREPLDLNPIFRHQIAPLMITPEHRRMQAKLLAQLQAEYGEHRVRIEVNGVDVLVETEMEIRLYEIKSDLSPRSVIRQALGQVLEYAFHPPRVHHLPVHLVIVGRNELGTEEQAYLDHLKTAFQLPLEYLVISI